MNLKKAPARLLHMFACDCAQRALLRQRGFGDEPAKELWGIVDARRRWLDGSCSEEMFAGVLESALLVFEGLPEDVSSVRRHAWMSALGVGESQPFKAAKSASMNAALQEAERATEGLGEEEEDTIDLWREAMERERLWQRGRFAWLTEIHGWAGGRMTFLIREGEITTPYEVAVEVGLHFPGG